MTPSCKWPILKRVRATSASATRANTIYWRWDDTSSPIPMVLNVQQLCQKVASKWRMAEVQPFRLRKVQSNIYIYIYIYRHTERKLRSNFSQLQSVRKLKRHSMWSRDSSFWRTNFVCWKGTSLPLIPVYFNAVNQEFHCIISSVHIICQVSAQVDVLK